MTRLISSAKFRTFCGLALIAACCVALLSSTPASGEERKFVVMLAYPAPLKSDPRPTGPLPNSGDIWDAYYDRFKNGVGGGLQIDSFAEYWQEISYGAVSVSGDVLGWVELPWTAVPPRPKLEEWIGTGENASFTNAQIPFVDLNNDKYLNFGAGEPVPLKQDQMILIDYNGASPPNAGGEFGALLPTPGLVDLDPLDPSGQTPIWTPGERFMDLNDNGVYDAWLEPFRDGYGTEDVCDQDGIVDSSEVCNIYIDGGSEWDFPEPFEDFMRVWVPETAKWERLDPSYKNGNDGVSVPDPTAIGSWGWAVAYITNNYPGDAGTPVTGTPGNVTPGSGFMGRFGNSIYDGPDLWTETPALTGDSQYEDIGSKMIQWGPGQSQWCCGGTPQPDQFHPGPTGHNYARWEGGDGAYELWWQAYWADKFAAAANAGATVVFTPAPAAPAWPAIQPTTSGGFSNNIPDLRPFDPRVANPLGLGGAGATTAKLPWEPNCGGTTARVPRSTPTNWPGPGAYPYPTENTCDPQLSDECMEGDPPVEKPCITQLTVPACVENPPLTHPTALPYPEYPWPWIGYPGDGTVDPRNSGVGGGRKILPDELDTNGDSIPDRYDGPAEYDDLPSSIYHAQSISGIEYGGDQALGEVTSVRNVNYDNHPPYGDDVGTGDPGGAGSGDHVIPAGGPLAYRVHGSNGYDGGNVLELEYITWVRSTSTDYATTPANVLKRDFNLDGLLDMGEVRRPGTENYSIDANLGTPNDGGPGMDYPFSRLRLTEDAVAALDPSVDWDNFVQPVHPACVAHGLDYDPNFGLLTGVDERTGGDGQPHAYMLIIDIAGGGDSAFLRLGDFHQVEGWAEDPATLTFYGSSIATDELIKVYIDPMAGWVVESVGALEFGEVRGLAFDSNTGTLYGSDTATDQLIRINTTTGRGAAVGALGVFGQVEGLAYDTVNNILYGTDTAQDVLITINTTSGAGTVVGSLQLPDVQGLAYAPDRGNLYGSDTTRKQLFTINPTTGLGLDKSRLNFLHSVVLLPGGLYDDGLAAGGRGLFQLPAPGMDLPIQIHEDDEYGLSPIWFSDFVSSLAGASETGQQLDAGSFGKELMAHEWLHVWEGYPDLYDYDEYIGGIINRPVGIWDIMSGGFVHPSPPLKERCLGKEGLGTAHLPWIQVRDLTDYIEPFEESTVVLPDYAFRPTDSSYYFQNTDPDKVGEFFYFYRETRVDPPNPKAVNFNRVLPGDGFMVMHTDFGTSEEGAPQQQRIGSHFIYNIVQADGLQQLENGENSGDAGDPFPDITPPLEVKWDAYTDPNSRWWGQVPSGLSITDVDLFANYSTATFFWLPLVVPSVQFIQPPSGIVIADNFQILYDAFDFYGGTSIYFYADEYKPGDTLPDTTVYAGYQGWAVGLDINPANGIPDFDLKGLPGYVEQSDHLVPVNVDRQTGGLAGDGVYYFYARMVPGPGQDGRVDPTCSTPKATLTNKGYGFVRGPLFDPLSPPADPNDPQWKPIIGVDADGKPISKLEQVRLQCLNSTVAGAELWKVTGTASGDHANATTGEAYTSNNGEVTFKLHWDAHFGSGSNASTFTSGGAYYLRDLSANFPAAEFKLGDKVRIVSGPAGVTPGYYTVLTVTDSDGVGGPDTLKLATNPGTAAGGVVYRVRAFTDGTQSASQPDRFSFITTGFSGYSSPVQILNGQVVPRTTPLIAVTYPDEATNPEHRVPLRVTFDASGSLDEFGQSNTSGLTYLWEFGDGTVSTQKTVTKTYNPYQAGWENGLTVKLTVTNAATAATGVAQVTIVILPGDADGDGVSDHVDNCPKLFNPGQENADGDSYGDACDPCPLVFTPLKPDTDGDGIRDDGDCSGVTGDHLCTGGNAVGCDDNCPGLYNPSQTDSDGDSVGDACDECPFDAAKTAPGLCGCGIPDQDNDGDGVLDCNVPEPPGPSDVDTDGDGVPDRLDRCPNDPNKVAPGVCGCGTPDVDSDGDGIFDCRDNCPFVKNTSQADSDLNAIGDACDSAPGDCGAGAGSCGAAGATLLPLMMMSLGWMRVGLRRNRRRDR